MELGQIAYEAARAERLSRRPSDEVIEWAGMNDGTRSMWAAAEREVAQTVTQAAVPGAYSRGKADEIAEANEAAIDHECPETTQATSKPSHAELALTLANELVVAFTRPGRVDPIHQADKYLTWLKANDTEETR